MILVLPRYTSEVDHMIEAFLRYLSAMYPRYMSGNGSNDPGLSTVHILDRYNDPGLSLAHIRDGSNDTDLSHVMLGNGSNDPGTHGYNDMGLPHTLVRSAE
jgi:hypothetical protein